MSWRELENQTTISFPVNSITLCTKTVLYISVKDAQAVLPCPNKSSEKDKKSWARNKLLCLLVLPKGNTDVISVALCRKPLSTITECLGAYMVNSGGVATEPP